MKKHLPLIASFVGCALLTILIVGGRVHDYRTLGADLLASTGFQSATSSAQDATSSPSTASTSAPTLVDVLQQLQDRVQSLGNQMTDFRSELEIIKLKTVFTRILRRGNSGNDVAKLQDMLAKMAKISGASTTTGYYGYATELAVRQFQAEEKLRQTGIFDASTRERFLQLISNHTAQEGMGTPTEFAPIDLSSVSGLSKTKASTSEAQISALSDTSNQTSPLASRVSSVETTIADLQNQVSQLVSNISNAQANLVTPAPSPTPTPIPIPTPTPTPTPSSTSTAPTLAISSIQAASTTRASSTITWLTNAPSTSEVDYSINSAVPTNQMTVVSNTALATSHRTVLQSLSANTRYYYRVVSKDITGIVASSTIQFFNTLL